MPEGNSDIQGTKTPSSSFICLKGVTKTYGEGEARVSALRNISLEVKHGELVIITGESGSGKSTLLNICGGLTRPDSGTVNVAGCNLASASLAELAQVRRELVGYVFQDYALISTLTCEENVALPLELAGMKAAQARHLALGALREVGVERQAKRLPQGLSGGQRQRVAIARALVGKERLILADEPTGALDSKEAEKIIEVLRERVDAGATCLLVSHEPRFAAWADREIRIVDGALEDTK